MNMDFEILKKDLLSDIIGNWYGVYLKHDHYNDCYSINGLAYSTAVEKKNEMKKSGKFKNLSVKKNSYGFGTIYFNIK